MSQFIRQSSFLLIVVCCAFTVRAQFRFKEEIEAFKKQDSISAPPANPILFVGSSSFRLWENLKSAFPGYPIINRGFGGSTLPEVIHYADQVIFKYHPRQIVIYCGDNDLASSDQITPEIVLDRFTTLMKLIRYKLPKVNVIYVSIKPSPSREVLMPKMKAANDLISAYLEKDKNASFADVYSKMLDANGLPMSNLYRLDQLHMNKDGYAIWQKILQPLLLK